MAETSLRMLGDRLLIEDETELEITHNGIVIPATAKVSTDHPYVATVITVGPGRLLKDGSRLPMSVKAGDKILYYRFAGDHVVDAGRERIIIRDEQVQGLIS